MIVLLTAFTLVAFAANSLICRMALGGNLMDPLSFTTVRLFSGALVLLPISRMFSESKVPETGGSWKSGGALFTYALAFSLAYVSLNTGVGALILFGSVQITMIGAAIRSGERLKALQWGGLLGALTGLVYLVFPGIAAPAPVGAFLMCVAGISWGIYSIRGKGSRSPVYMTAGNFQRSVPFVAVASLLGLASARFTSTGLVLALTSGALTSGIGYVLWYRVLRDWTTTQAAVLQLLVPVLAAFGGVVLLDERLTYRLALSSALILGGVGVTVIRRGPPPKLSKAI